MITCSQEEWLWDLCQYGRDNRSLSSWERGFLAENESRWSEDHLSYFLSPKMKLLLSRIEHKIWRD